MAATSFPRFSSANDGSTACRCIAPRCPARARPGRLSRRWAWHRLACSRASVFPLRLRFGVHSAWPASPCRSCYGAAGGGALSNAADWLQSSLAQDRWQLSINDQSLRALVLRMGGTPTLALGLAALCAVVVLVIAGTRSRDALSGLGAVLLASVLAAPIAWIHYYVLAFPGWAAVLRNSSSHFGRVRGTALILAAVATSGFLTIGPRFLRHALLQGSVYAWGSLVLLAALEWSGRHQAKLG